MAKNLMALIVGAAALLMAASTPVVALAGGSHSGGSAGCGCKTPPPPPPPKSCGCNHDQHHQPQPPTINVIVKTDVSSSASASAGASAIAAARVSGFAGAQSSAYSSGGGSSGVIPGSVSAVNLSVGGGDREAYEATRTRIEKVVIQAFCFDDKDVPHPASQVAPERDVDEAYEGEIYRCIAGTHMQVTIAQFREKISFEGGQTLACQKGEALYHIPGHGAGKLECRPQKPARDCNERSLLRRFGAGIKVLTMIYTEKYTAYRESSHESEAVSMSFDGGVGGIAY